MVNLGLISGNSFAPFKSTRNKPPAPLVWPQTKKNIKPQVRDGVEREVKCLSHMSKSWAHTELLNPNSGFVLAENLNQRPLIPH